MSRRLAPLLLLTAFACGDDDDVGAPPPAVVTPTPDAGPRFAITASPVVSFLCAQFTLEGPFPAASDVTLAADPLTKTFGSEADCASGVLPTAVRVEANEASRSFWLRTASDVPVTLSATASFGTASVSFTPQVFRTIGQQDPRTMRQGVGFATVFGVALAPGKLIATEEGFGRARMWTGFDAPAASVTLGWLDESSDTRTRVPSASSFGQGTGVWTDGTRLVVTDPGFHRVLVWNTFPTTNLQPADLVLGQPSFTSQGRNTGGVSGVSMSSPVGVHSDGTRLFVADAANHRVLVWNTFPTSSGQSASFALGQPDLVTGGSQPTSATSISSPYAITTAGTKLFVTDISSARVLVWNTMPAASGAPADFALGHPAGPANLTASAIEPISAASLRAPFGIASDGTRLVVTDVEENRALVWSTLPTTGGQAATFALGQSSFTSGAAQPLAASSLDGPAGVSIDADRLAIVDYRNNRVLAWNTFPTTMGQPADLVKGRPDFTTRGRSGIAIDATTIDATGPVTVDGTRMYLADAANDRVLVWNTLPRSPADAPSFAIGQSGLATYQQPLVPSATNVADPAGAWVIAGKLFVADATQNRVLVWNTPPTAAGQPADYAIGQPDLTTSAPFTMSDRLRSPSSVASDGTRLFVADQGNNRVMVWNTIPTTSGVAANYALGQSNLSTADATNISAPASVRVLGGKLYVVDGGHDRILVWNTIPTQNGQPPDFTIEGGLEAPTDVDTDGTTLFVVDGGDHRVLTYSPVPTAAGAPPTGVLGQPNLTTLAGNAGAHVSAEGLLRPSAIRVEPTRLLVTDRGNWRVSIMGR